MSQCYVVLKTVNKARVFIHREYKMEHTDIIIFFVWPNLWRHQLLCLKVRYE